MKKKLLLLGLAGLVGPVLAYNPGDLVITEIMQNPSAVSDSYGEYFELYNATGGDIDLDGMTIMDDDYDDHIITGTVIIPSGGYGLFVRNGDPLLNGGLPDEDYEYGGDIALANGGDELVIVDTTNGSTELARVEYSGACPWPDPTGHSMFLKNLAGPQNDPSNWWETPSDYPYGDGDYGTPGAANPTGNLPPVICWVSQDPGAPGSADIVTVTADVLDDSGIAEVNLIYTVDGGAPNAVPMATLVLTVYAGDIPAQANGAYVEYYVEATDVDDATTESYTYDYTVMDVVPTHTIAEIQDPGGDPSGDSAMLGLVVNTSGIVTQLDYNSFFIQDAEALWSGIKVYGDNSAVAIGDEVDVTGQVSEYYNMTQLSISGPADYTVLSSGNPVPDFIVVDCATANSEAAESVKVRAENTTCTNPDMGYGEWEISDVSGSCLVNDLFADPPAGHPVLDYCYHVQGIVFYSYGAFKIEPLVETDVECCTVIEAEDLPTSFALLGNYPNPFNPNTVIRFSLDQASETSLVVRDLLGRTVSTLVDGVVEKGEHTVSFDASNLASGIYFYTLQSEGRALTGRMLLVR